MACDFEERLWDDIGFDAPDAGPVDMASVNAAYDKHYAECAECAAWLANEEAYREEMRDPGNHPMDCDCGACQYAEEEARREHERMHSAARLG